MNVKCMAGFHKWNGCICSTCGKTRKHQWSDDKCNNCAQTRLNITNQLITAIEFKRHSEIESLINNGADINGKDKYGDPIIHAAINKYDKDIKSFNIILLFIAKGADIHAVGSSSGSTLNCAVRTRSAKLLAKLIDLGLDVNSDNTLLHAMPGTYIHPIYWEDDDYLEMIKCLLVKGADVSRTEHLSSGEDTGKTALHIAAQAGAKEVVKLLLANGAAANMEDWIGNTPLEYAEKKRRECMENPNDVNKVEYYDSVISLLKRSIKMNYRLHV